ncbi:GRB2-associated-binding protein 2 [Cloeon dipterum]|uniref:GRB2-associated-binding protein 2 n=1 Tax=Cloeon dipterum TaxID=197152 RepID=UPI0032204833
MSKRHSNEIVHEGWLTKSPPTQRLWRAVSRWRRRWFVLRQGDLPAQYWLEYYTDKKCLKLKGRIDLDQCEQVDAGIESPAHLRVKCRENLFDLKTPRRTYYLAADSKVEMDKWVECVCRVCGLRAEMDATFGSVEVEELSFPPLTDPEPPSQSSGSTPYIFISECYSGQPPPGVLTKQLEAQVASMTSRGQKPTRLFDAPHPVDDFYDQPRTLAAPVSLAQADDDVFTWDVARAPSVNWNTFPRDSVSELSLKRASESSEASTTEEQPSSAELGSLVAAQRFSRAIGGGNGGGGEEVSAPPRPPKPSHLAEVHSYLNIESVLENRASAPTRPAPRSPDCLDEMYDFPRQHPAAGRNCYSNAAATTSSSSSTATGTVFQFEVHETSEEPGTPRSEDDSEELGSPPPPPSVHRDLKPRRSEPSPSPAPCVDRALKPRRRNAPDSPDEQAFTLAAPPTQRGAEGRQRRQRAAPSPTPPGTFGPVGAFFHGNSCSEESDEEQNFFHIVNNKFVPSSKGLDKLKYLDLDLEMGGASGGLASRQPSKSTLSLGPPTIYNTVDFVKTQAFNRTRKEVESLRQLPH